jgi:hypothetical protein
MTKNSGYSRSSRSSLRGGTEREEPLGIGERFFNKSSSQGFLYE